MNTEQKSSSFLWGSVVIIILLVVAGLYFAITDTKPNGSIPQETEILKTITDKDWVKGNASGTVTLIEYADFQCPGCRGFYPFVKQLESDFPQLRIVFRHFPLGQHGNARIAARAAEAAGLQGKFFEMHDKLFETQTDWERSGTADKIFIEYAKVLGLNVDQFDRDMRSTATGDIVQDNYESGLRFGVSSTPTFFLNNTKLNFPRNYAELSDLIKAAIANPSGDTTKTNASSTPTTQSN